MAYFLVQGSYTAEAMAAMVKNPEDRSIHIRAGVEKLGGKLEGFWLAFGEHDFFLVVQLPDAQAAAAFGIAAAAGGGVRGLRTIPLLTWAEGISAMKQAAAVGYRPPGKKA